MIDPAERALLEETVRAGLERAPDADARLVELGWLEMLQAEPQDAVAIVFSALGTTNAVATALDDVVVGALGLPPSPDRAVLLPPFASWSPPARRDGAGVRASGLASVRATTARELVVAAGREAGEPQLVIVPITAAHVVPVRGIDPGLGLHRVDLAVEVDVAEPHDIDFDLEAWGAAIAAGRLALAHQISGACRVMLDLACEHAVERVQFGRPIARFQAVRHRLADALVAVESLDAALGGRGRGTGSHDQRARQGDRGTHCADCRRALPTGAGGDRLHHRSRVPPLPEAHARPRRPVRQQRRDRHRHRPRPHRHAPRSHPHRTLTPEASK